MESDFYFRLGSTHAICQDYALSGKVNGKAYAIVSDGCSGSPTGEPGSPHTDFGSRFLVRAAQRHLAEISEGVFPAETIITEATAMRRQCELSSSALDATLLVATQSANSEYLRVFRTGDGVIASRTKDGKITYETLHFGNNAPYYLNYISNPARHLQFLCPNPDTPGITKQELEAAGTVTVVNGWFNPQTGWGEPVSTLESVQEGVVRSSVFSAEDTDLVMILSDGAESFQLKDGTPIPLEHVLDQLFAIKSFPGEFLVRRCNRFLQKFCAERGWQHSDDFSVAGIYLGTL